MIRRSLIFAGHDCKNKDDVIRFIADAADKAGLLADEEEFIRTVYRREEEISTAVGHGIAIPHGKSDAVREAFIAYAGLKSGFEWDEETGEQAEMIFLIGVPKAGAEVLHLKAIAAISRNLMREGFRERLKACRDSDRAYELLREIDREIAEGKEEEQ